MKNIRLSIICILLLASCANKGSKGSDEFSARVQYVDFLNAYWSSGDASNVDSALKYNAYVLESDTAGVIDYFYRIQMFDLCERYDSALSIIDRMPQDLVLWPPEYKSYLRLKCKAIMAEEAHDMLGYKKNLDSIITLWTPLMTDSIAKVDSLLSLPLPFDDILFQYGHLLVPYTEYYNIMTHLNGKDSVVRILAAKKEKFNWNDDTYDDIVDFATSDGGALTLS